MVTASRWGVSRNILDDTCDWDCKGAPPPCSWTGFFFTWSILILLCTLCIYCSPCVGFCIPHSLSLVCGDYTVGNGLWVPSSLLCSLWRLHGYVVCGDYMVGNGLWVPSSLLCSLWRLHGYVVCGDYMVGNGLWVPSSLLCSLWRLHGYVVCGGYMVGNGLWVPSSLLFSLWRLHGYVVCGGYMVGNGQFVLIHFWWQSGCFCLDLFGDFFNPEA